MKTNLNSTRLEDHAEISIIEAPDRVSKVNTPEKVPKTKQNTPRSKVKTSSSAKRMNVEPSPSVLTKKKTSPKSSARKKITYSFATDSSIITPRPRRNVMKNPIVDSEDETDKESETDWSDDDSYSDSDVLTDDDSDNGVSVVSKPKSTRGKNVAGASATKRSSKKPNKNELIYLDLSSEEIHRVDENFHANVSEDDLANITRKFLAADLNDEE